MSITPLSRFLTLPMEIRLMVYDFLPFVTRHHIISAREPSSRYYQYHSRTVVSKRNPGVALLATCRQLHSEFSAHMGVIAPQPLRLIGGRNNFDGELTKHVLSCASESSALQLQGGVELITGPSGVVYVRRDPNAPRALHNIIDRGPLVGKYTVAHSPSYIEIAVDCGTNFLRRIDDLTAGIKTFFSWVMGFGRPRREGEVLQIHIVLRLMWLGKPDVEGLEAVNLVINEAFPEGSWDGRTWVAEFGELIGEAELKEHWQEGSRWTVSKERQGCDS